MVATETSAPAETPAAAKSITIKKYANRRLYNTATSSYVTLEHLSRMVKEGTEFLVYDAKTGDDITRSVLTQIIVEEEAKGQNLLPISFLRHLISFYGDSLQALVPRYLEYAMHSFARNQEQMRQYIREAMGGLFPFGQFEEMGKQQVALFESAVKMFSPFYREEPPRSEGAKADTNGAEGRKVEELRAKLAEIEKQLQELSARRKAK